jgi:hypothetical protein
VGEQEEFAMPVAGKSKVAKKLPGARRPRAAAALPSGAIVPNDPPKAAFVRALVDRGEAATLGPKGKLPPGATHEIVGTTAEGLPIVVRRRFAASSIA